MPTIVLNKYIKYDVNGVESFMTEKRRWNGLLDKKILIAAYVID